MLIPRSWKVKTTKARGLAQVRFCIVGFSREFGLLGLLFRTIGAIKRFSFPRAFTLGYGQHDIGCGIASAVEVVALGLNK